MITVLVAGAEEGGADEFAAGHASVEVMTARGAEDALEKLARNRRIDAVLIVAGKSTADLAVLIREEDPGAPPLYAAAGAGAIPGVRPLDAVSVERLLDALVRDLSPGA